MRLAGRLKLGFYPLPTKEAERIRARLQYQDEFAALDPCVGDGVAFSRLLESAKAYAYGIDIDAFRAEQAGKLGIQVVQANAMDVRCPAESLSLLYLNPPYDFEVSQQGNKRLELVFLEHTCRWLKPKGVLIFVIPRLQMKVCARMLAEQFTGFRLYRLTEPECIKYDQVVVLAFRRGRNTHLEDAALLQASGYLAGAANEGEVPSLTDTADTVFPIPPSAPVVLTNRGIPLDPGNIVAPTYSLLPRTRSDEHFVRCLFMFFPVHPLKWVSNADNIEFV